MHDPPCRFEVDATFADGPMDFAALRDQSRQGKLPLDLDEVTVGRHIPLTVRPSLDAAAIDRHDTVRCVDREIGIAALGRHGATTLLSFHDGGPAGSSSR